MKIFLSCLLVLVGLQSFAQDSLVIEVVVKDANYEGAVRNAKVSLSHDTSAWQKRTNSKGKTYFQIPYFSKISFNIQHSQYEPSSELKSIHKRFIGDTMLVKFDMFYRQQNFKEVVVPAPGVPMEVYGSKRVHVEDFEILPNGNVLMLTYPKRLKKGNELKLFDGINVLQSFQINDRAIELVRDYRGNPHVVCEKGVYGLQIDNSRIGILTLDRSYFIKYIAPIIDTNAQRMYFSTFNPDYPAFEYFKYDQLDSTYSKVVGIKDDLMMELYRAEYKWADVRTKLYARTQEMYTGIDAEDWVGANYFTQSVYYKEVYAPLFHRNDSLFVFDYYKDILFTFDKEGNKIDSTGIYHHYQPKRTGWKKNVIQDKVTGQIYATYERGGYTFLGRINTTTGKVEEQVQLEYKYVGKVAVHNNSVYYIYRPFESIQKKYLYKEKLPYKFKSVEVPSGDLTVKKK